MPKFLIERNMPGLGKLTAEQLNGASKTSCAALKSVGPQIQWLESFVTDDKMYCVYIAPDEATVLQHAKTGGFSADSIKVIRTIIDPTTAE